MTARYFVKVTDNNGDASELEADPSDNPFFDGDGIITTADLSMLLLNFGPVTWPLAV